MSGSGGGGRGGGGGGGGFSMQCETKKNTLLQEAYRQPAGWTGKPEPPIVWCCDTALRM